jgi:hypothetical protein
LKQFLIDRVWPWLAQLGQAHGGFYTYEWLENLFAAQMHNADRIFPEWQSPQVGHNLSLMENGPALIIAWVKPDEGFAAKGGWGYYPIFEALHFVMESGRMIGLKQPAERSNP